MFTFSDQHAWQGNEAVQQILVFPNDRVKAKFESIMKERNEAAAATDKNDVSDSDAGAIYKLRAVKNSKGEYIPIIRCGIDGYQLWESINTYEFSDVALEACLEHLNSTVDRNITSIVELMVSTAGH